MRRARPWLLAAGAGIALGLALPGPGWSPLVLLFPPLLLEALRAASVRRGLLLGWLAGTTSWIVGVRWVTPVMSGYGGLPKALAVGALVLLAVILASTWALSAALTAAAPARLRPWLWPAAFTACEAARQFLPFRFPWNPVAAVLAHRPPLLGSLPVWGASGLGWAVVAVGAGAWALAHADTRRSGQAILVAATGLTVVATVVAPPFLPSGRPVTVALLQPGTTLEERWDPSRWQEVAARVWRQTGEAARAGAELVLWPEGAVPFRLEDDPGFAAEVERVARTLDVAIILNSIGRTADGEPTNSAYAVTPAGVVHDRYDKIHLVPFGEYVPAPFRLAVTESLVREVGSFAPGTSAEPLPTGTLEVGMAICYEVVFADLAAHEVRAGADVLVTITNDAWYGFSAAPEQHFAQAILRAVETRRWLARAALTGISGFVSPTGEVVSSLPVGESGILVHDLRAGRGLTPRARFGDWFALVCALAAAFLLVAGRHRRSRSASRSGERDAD